MGLLLLFLTLLWCLSAVVYYGYAIFAALDFFTDPMESDPHFHPPATVLKPICGLDWNLYENLASFCQQDYLEYQIVFGVQDANDPGLSVVKQIIQDFPERDIQLVVSDRKVGPHYKINNFANAIAEAKHSILILSDSDVRVGRDYLSQVVQPLNDLKVGVVTCIYRNFTETWIAAFEALGIATEFLPSVLVARKLEGVKFGFGQTIVIRRSVLEAIGGFQTISQYLADDFQLGYLPAQAGYRVVLSHYLVDHFLVSDNFASLLRRQIRWALGNRFSRPWGYLGIIFTHGIVASLGFLFVTGGSALGWAVLEIVWMMRMLMAWVIAVKNLQDPAAEKLLWLVPLRDLVSFALWCYSLVGNRVDWHGRQFKLLAGGRLVEQVPDHPQPQL